MEEEVTQTTTAVTVAAEPSVGEKIVDAITSYGMQVL